MSMRKVILTTTLALAVACMFTTAALAQSMPAAVYGHVKVNGAAVSGVSVSLSGGKTATADGSGFYQFGVTNGSQYTVTASYNGHSAQKTFTVNADHVEVDLNIVYSTSSATPTASATATATATASPSSGGSSGGTFTYTNSAATTPTPTPAVTATPTLTPTPAATSTIAPATPTPEAQQNEFPWWMVALLAAIVIIIGAGYFFMRRS